MKPKSTEAYVAIRIDADDGHEWMDVHTTRVSAEWCREEAIDIDSKCGPEWAAQNPVVRIMKVLLKEIA